MTRILSSADALGVGGKPAHSRKQGRLKRRFAHWGRPENLVMLAVSLAISLALLYPLAIVILRSFELQPGFAPPTFSLGNYARFASSITLDALGNSFLIAIASSVLVSGLLGVTLAWINARTDMPFRGALHCLTLVPFFISPLVGALAWSMLASPRVGLLNQLVMRLLGVHSAPFNIYSMGGIVWVEGLFHVPFVYMFCVGPFRNMDPSVEEAARMSGAGRFGITFRVTLPLAGPAILSAILLAFVLAFDELGAPLVLGAPFGTSTVSILIYEGINRFPADYNFGAALGVLMMAVTGAATLVQRRIMGKRSFATVSGRGFRPVRIHLRWGRYLALAINLVYLLVAMILPILALALVSVQRVWLGYFDPHQLTAQYYAYIIADNPLAARALANSTLLSALGATIAVAIAMVVAYVIHRTRSWGRGLLDLITTMPIGISGLVMALGLLVALIRTPLYGTLWIILAAYVIRYFTYSQRSISGSLLSISKDLEESSRTTGAGWATTIRRVLMPLVLPGLIGSWILCFTTFMRESSMSLLLSRSGTETLSVALYNILINDSIGAVAAFTVIQVFIILALVALFFRVVGQEGIKV